MAERRNRYKQLQWLMAYALTADFGIFLLYLVFAGFGVIWLKVITAILVIVLSLACLALLYMSRELLRPRSLWMSMSAAAILLCLLVSLLLNYPSPNKYAQPNTNQASSSVQD